MAEKDLHILWLKCFPRRQLLLFNSTLGSFHFLRRRHVRRWATAPSSSLIYYTCSASLRFHTGCPPDVQCYLPTEGCDKTPENQMTAICHLVIIIYFFISHYSPPYVTVFSVQITYCSFLLISFTAIFNFNDILLLRIFLRA